MEKISEQLKNRKPNLSPSSFKTYISILDNLYKKMKGSGDAFDFFKKNTNKIVEHLKDEQPNIRKTKMAVLISLLGNDANTEKLKNVMLEDANKYNATLRTQQMNEKQKKNWLNEEEIKGIYKQLSKQALPLMKKESLDKRDYGKVLDYVLLSLYVLMPPRRSQDFTEMKIRNYDKEKDNYFDGKMFYFVKYKTSKIYGRQEIKPPPKLRNILNKWSILNKHDYLLSSFNGNKISVLRMALLLNKIFGKKISTTMLRHIYISDNVLKDAPLLQVRDKIAEAMGHSVETQEIYKKVKD